MYEIPDFFKNSYNEVIKTVKTLKNGRVYEGGRSAGGRAIFVVEYGIPNVFERTANYSSALGAGDVSCFAKNTHPCILIIGGTHGGEFEGTAAILNLFSLLESGADLRGEKHNELLSMMEKCHIVFVPCINPDGRCRVPFEGVAGMEFEKFRYYNQGTWANGDLCGWPGCKRVHPIENVGHLGGYFNDDKINLMHDDFFRPMANETKLLISLATKYAPNMTVNLHGAADTGYGIYAPGYAAKKDRELARKFEQRLCKAFRSNGFSYTETGCFTDEPEFNLTTALYLCCGGLSITWESYQGVLGKDSKLPPKSIYNDILNAHFLFFYETFQQLGEKQF